MMMMKIILMTTTIMFMICNHPLSMGLVLILNTIIISLYTGMKSFNFWYSYILFMVMVGGMMILFIYMTSITANEKFEMPYKMMLPIALMMLMAILWNNSNETMQSLNNEEMSKELIVELSLTKYMNKNSMLITIMLMIYLLITLIAVVKITDINMGPLRKI